MAYQAYRPRPVTARIIFDDLQQNGESSKWAIMRRTGLTQCQFGYGLGYVKDVLQTANGQPLIWETSRGVYDLTSNAKEWAYYVESFRLRSLATQLRRVELTVIAGQMKGLGKKRHKLLLAGLQSARRIIESLLP